MTKDERLEGLRSLLGVSDGPVLALVVNEAETNSFLSKGHTSDSVAYAASFLLQYLGEIAREEEDAELAQAADACLDSLYAVGYALVDDTRAAVKH